MLRRPCAAPTARLGPHQQIGGWSVWPEPDFPRTPSLKVKRAEVLAALASSIERRRRGPRRQRRRGHPRGAGIRAAGPRHRPPGRAHPARVRPACSTSDSTRWGGWSLRCCSRRSLGARCPTSRWQSFARWPICWRRWSSRPAPRLPRRCRPGRARGPSRRIRAVLQDAILRPALAADLPAADDRGARAPGRPARAGAADREPRQPPRQPDRAGRAPGHSPAPHGRRRCRRLLLHRYSAVAVRVGRPGRLPVPPHRAGRHQSGALRRPRRRRLQPAGLPGGHPVDGWDARAVQAGHRAAGPRARACRSCRSTWTACSASYRRGGRCPGRRTSASGSASRCW